MTTSEPAPYLPSPRQGAVTYPPVCSVVTCHDCGQSRLALSRIQQRMWVRGHRLLGHCAKGVRW